MLAIGFAHIIAADHRPGSTHNSGAARHWWFSVGMLAQATSAPRLSGAPQGRGGDGIRYAPP